MNERQKKDLLDLPWAPADESMRERRRLVSRLLDALRVWVSPRLVLGSKAQLRAVIVNQSDLAHRAGVRYRITLHQDKREQPLIEKTVDGRVLDLGFLVPRAGRQALCASSCTPRWTASASVAVPIELIEAPEPGVMWSEPWRAYAAQSPADPAERVNAPGSGFARPSLPGDRLGGPQHRAADHPQTSVGGALCAPALKERGQLGTVFDHEGFAQITMGQPLHRGRYRVEIADAAGTWARTTCGFTTPLGATDHGEQESASAGREDDLTSSLRQPKEQLYLATLPRRSMGGDARGRHERRRGDLGLHRTADPRLGLHRLGLGPSNR